MKVYDVADVIDILLTNVCEDFTGFEATTEIIDEALRYSMTLALLQVLRSFRFL